MKKEFVVTSVAVSPARRSDVVISLLEENFVVHERTRHECRGSMLPLFQPSHYIQSECSTRFFMNFAEYESLALRVGDRVTLRIAKARKRGGGNEGLERIVRPTRANPDSSQPS